MWWKQNTQAPTKHEGVEGGWWRRTKEPWQALVSVCSCIRCHRVINAHIYKTHSAIHFALVEVPSDNMIRWHYRNTYVFIINWPTPKSTSFYLNIQRVHFSIRKHHCIPVGFVRNSQVGWINGGVVYLSMHTRTHGYTEGGVHVCIWHSESRTMFRLILLLLLLLSWRRRRKKMCVLQYLARNKTHRCAHRSPQHSICVIIFDVHETAKSVSEGWRSFLQYAHAVRTEKYALLMLVL